MEVELDKLGFLVYYTNRTWILTNNEAPIRQGKHPKVIPVVRHGGRISVDGRSGVPFYRQIIDQVLLGIAGGHLKPGQRLPTVRQLAIDLQVNPNTVSRAYRELEIRGVVTTQRGTGTFVAAEPGVAEDAAKRMEFLERFCDEFAAEAGKFGFSLQEVVEALRDRLGDKR